MSTTNNNNDSKNVLNSDVELKGTLRFTGEMTFDGKLEGDIQSEGTLNLGDNAVVKGNITANSVLVRGKVNGNVTAKEKIDIKTKTELFGDIRAAEPDLAVCDSETCRWQISHGTGRTSVHPVEVMYRAYGLG